MKTNYSVSLRYLVVSLLLFQADYTRADEPEIKLDAAADCAAAKNYKCYGACMDGWGFECYYDSRTSALVEGKGVAAQKDNCFAYHDVSSCNPCVNEFDYQGKKVSCEDFYSQLKDFNKSCGGCLKKQSDYGG